MIRGWLIASLMRNPFAVQIDYFNPDFPPNVIFLLNNMSFQGPSMIIFFNFPLMLLDSENIFIPVAAISELRTMFFISYKKMDSYWKKVNICRGDKTIPQYLCNPPLPNHRINPHTSTWGLCLHIPCLENNTITMSHKRLGECISKECRYLL